MTFSDKLTAVNAFLINRAQLRRVTNHEELQRVTGKLLFNGGRRYTSKPVSRDSIIEVLKAVDQLSMVSKNIMLSALVEHFFDNGITPRFFDQAVERGLLDPDASAEERQAFHAAQLTKIYAAYPATETPDDLSELFETGAEYEEEDSEEDSEEGIYLDTDA